MKMTHKKLQRGRSANRSRPRKRSVLVVVGGVVTEREYFKILRQEIDASLKIKACGKDPAGLVEKAADYARDEVASGADPFSAVLVVTDVDDFSASQLREAERLCQSKRNKGFRLVVSNPCFEVWLIDHVEPCPDTVYSSRSAQDRASVLGLLQGRKKKSITPGSVEGRLFAAISSAAVHNTEERRSKRSRLDTTDFAPWTDMPSAVKMLL